MMQTTAERTDTEIRDLLEAEGVDLGNVRRIPLDRIKAGRFQPRTVFDETSLKRLAESMRGGQVEPGILNEMDDGTFELIAGERRVRALRLIGRMQFRAAVVKIRDPKLLSRLALASNAEREGLSDLEMLDYCIRQREEFGMSDEEIAASHGRSVQWVSNTFSLDRLHGNLRFLLGSTKAKGFSRGVGLQLVRLAPLDQLTAISRIREGTVGEKRARRIVDELLADGEARPHPAAQDRSTPTDAFVRVMLGGLSAAGDGLKRLNSGPRRRKLGEVDPSVARQVRERLDTIEALARKLREALPAA